MANLMANSDKKLTTGRFKLPDNMIPLIERMRLIGPDLLVYTDKLDELTELFAAIGFTKVARKFQLHVSADNEDTFKKLFTTENLEYESRPTNTNRFIATVSLNTQEEYNHYLEFDTDQSNGCRIKPYKPRFASSTRDESSDTHENVDHSDQYQRHPQENRNQYHNDGKGGKGGKGFQGKGFQGKGFKGGYTDRRENDSR